MKKILFLMRYPLNDRYNLKFKFDGQMLACVNLGFEVYYLAYDAKYYYLYCKNTDSKQIICRSHFTGYKKYRSTIAFYDLYYALNRILKNERYDYIYMRKKMALPSAIEALKKHKNKGGKVFVEIPTYGVNEVALSRVRSLATLFFSNSEKKLMELVDLYILIGNACPSNYCGKPAVEISNGIYLKTMPIKKNTPLNEEMHMLALASMRDWQGYDRVIKGINLYNGTYKLYLHLVGTDDDGSVTKWVQLSKNLGIEDSVIYHGPLYENELSDIFDICHIALGALALHRKGGNSASTLKVREYIARGIPFIYGYNDSGLIGDEWFAKKVSSDESAIDFHAIIPWAITLQKKERKEEQMRQYAKDHLSWESQFKKIMEFEENIG